MIFYVQKIELSQSQYLNIHNFSIRLIFNIFNTSPHSLDKVLGYFPSLLGPTRQQYFSTGISKFISFTAIVSHIVLQVVLNIHLLIQSLVSY